MKINNLIYTAITLLSIFLAICFNTFGKEKSKRYYIDPESPKGLREIFINNNDKVAFLSAHRGGPTKDFPENHTITFDNTLKYTYAIMEIDPRYTKDSVIIVHHDNDLRRTTTGEGRVSNFTYDELMKLNLRDMKGNPTSYKLQTLKEMFEWAKGKTILVLDKKDVSIEERVKIVEECNAEAYAIVMAYTPEEAIKAYQMNNNIMMQIFIPTFEALDKFDRSGVPWENVVVFAGHQFPKDVSLLKTIQNKGAYCIVGTSRNFDLEVIRGVVHNIYELKKSYNLLSRLGANIIETDIPIEVSKIMYDDIYVYPSKRKYYK